jgi:VanZ family protein
VIPTRRLRYVKNWVPVLFWAALIFVFSTEIFSGGNTAGVLEPVLRYLFPVLSGRTIDIIHVVIRKFGHFAEYFVLAVLVMRALRQEPGIRLSPRRLALGLALTALYALTDEFHQAFVPSRSASVADVLLDVFGGICGTVPESFRSLRKFSRVRS